MRLSIRACSPVVLRFDWEYTEVLKEVLKSEASGPAPTGRPTVTAGEYNLLISGPTGT
jgi:hypothetical protein